MTSGDGYPSASSPLVARQIGTSQRVVAWLSAPFNTAGKRHTGEGPFAYVEITTIWHRVRYLGCIAAIVIGTGFAFTGMISEGAAVGIGGLLALIDTRYRISDPAAPLWPAFAIDAALIGLAAPIAGIPLASLLAALGYLGTAAFLFLQPRKAVAVVTGISLIFVASGAISAMAPTDLIHQSWQVALAGGLTWTLFLFGLVWIATRGVGAFHRERETAQVRLESLMAAKDRFVATVSHEVRNPLTAVVGLSTQLRDAPELFTAEERDELLALIASQAREAAGIVEDLLVAARLDDGNVKVHIRHVDLNREVSAVLASIEGSKSVRYNPDPRPFAQADPARVRQIVRNLITNAQRYGGPTITVTCGAGFVAVEDDGPGIPHEDRELIFEAYGQSSSHRHDASSTGLGLAVSRSLARLMDGDLGYHRAGGRSIFRLDLPSAGSPHAREMVDPTSTAAPVAHSR